MSLTGFSGAAGIKYGLNVRGPKKPAGAVPRPTLAAFAAPSDDEGDDDDGGDGRVGANAQIARQQQKAAQKARPGEAGAALTEALTRRERRRRRCMPLRWRRTPTCLTTTACTTT